MNKNELIEIAEFFASSKLNRLAWREGDFSLELEKNAKSTAPVEEVVLDEEASEKVSVSKTMGNESKKESTEENTEPEEEGVIVRSPVVGTFYSLPSPDEPPFVTIGQRVSKGDVICIIEAMKVFSDITSPVNGVVKSIVPKNGDLLEFDQKIMVIEEQ